jgi:hypothetical protein
LCYRKEVYPNVVEDEKPMKKLPPMKSRHYVFETTNQFTQGVPPEVIAIGDYDVDM